MVRWNQVVACAAVGLALAACRSETKQEQTSSSTSTTVATTSSPAPDTTSQPPVATATTPPPMTPAENPLRISPGMPTALPRLTPQATTATVENMEDAIARVPRITSTDLKSEVDSGKAVVIDVRGPAFFTSHIAGAENIPEAQLPMVIAQLPRDKKIVTYCT